MLYGIAVRLRYIFILFSDEIRVLRKRQEYAVSPSRSICKIRGRGVIEMQPQPLITDIPRQLIAAYGQTSCFKSLTDIISISLRRLIRIIHSAASFTNSADKLIRICDHV